MEVDFKDLKQKGYATLFSEDNSRFGSFNYRLHGRSTDTLVDDTLYQLQFVTSPNEGIYEASVKMKRGGPSLAGDVSRINAYKDQPPVLRRNFHFHGSIVTAPKLLTSGHDNCRLRYQVVYAKQQ